MNDSELSFLFTQQEPDDMLQSDDFSSGEESAENIEELQSETVKQVLGNGAKEEKKKDALWFPASNENYNFTESSEIEKHKKSSVCEIDEENSPSQNLFYTGETNSLPKIPFSGKESFLTPARHEGKDKIIITAERPQESEKDNGKEQPRVNEFAKIMETENSTNPLNHIGDQETPCDKKKFDISSSMTNVNNDKGKMNQHSKKNLVHDASKIVTVEKEKQTMNSFQDVAPEAKKFVTIEKELTECISTLESSRKIASSLAYEFEKATSDNPSPNTFTQEHKSGNAKENLVEVAQEDVEQDYKSFNIGKEPDDQKKVGEHAENIVESYHSTNIEKESSNQAETKTSHEVHNAESSENQCTEAKQSDHVKNPQELLSEISSEKKEHKEIIIVEENLANKIEQQPLSGNDLSLTETPTIVCSALTPMEEKDETENVESVHHETLSKVSCIDEIPTKVVTSSKDAEVSTTEARGSALSRDNEELGEGKRIIDENEDEYPQPSTTDRVTENSVTELSVEKGDGKVTGKSPGTENDSANGNLSSQILLPDTNAEKGNEKKLNINADENKKTESVRVSGLNIDIPGRWISTKKRATTRLELPQSGDNDETDVNGIDFSRSSKDKCSINDTQENEEDNIEWHRNELVRLRRGIPELADESEHINSELEENTEESCLVTSQDDPNISALYSLINGYEETITAYERKINKMGEELLNKTKIIKDQGREIKTLKLTHQRFQRHIKKASEILMVRQSSVKGECSDSASTANRALSDKTSSSYESDTSSPSSTQEHEFDDDPAEQHDTKESIRENSKSDLAAETASSNEVPKEENWDDSGLLEKSNNHLTRKSVMRITHITREFLSGSQSGSYKSLLWKPIWDVLKIQGKESAEYDISWKQGRNSNDLGPTWVFMKPLATRKKRLGIDYFESENDVLVQILNSLKDFDSNLISERDLSDLEDLCGISIISDSQNVTASSNLGKEEISTRGKALQSRKIKRKNAENLDEQPKRAKTSKSKNNTNLTSKKRRHSVTKQKDDEKEKNNSKCHKVKVDDQKVNDTKKIREKDISPLEQPPSKEGQPKRDSDKKGKKISVHSQYVNQNKDVERKKNTDENLNPSKKSDHNFHNSGTNADGLLWIGNLDHLENEEAASTCGISNLVAMRLAARKKPIMGPEHELRTTVTNEMTVVTPPKSDRNIEIPLQLSQSPDSPLKSNITSLSSVKNRNSKLYPLQDYYFLVSGIKTDTRECIAKLGGTIFDDIEKLTNFHYDKKLFFLSEPYSRKRHKYVLAAALGVPMLHFSWVHEFQELFKSGKTKSVFDGALYSKKRLPTGLALNKGTYILQRASDAKRWRKPRDIYGKPIFSGMSISIVLENTELELYWEVALRSLGASVIRSKSKVDVEKLDACVVDSLDFPPFSKAFPSQLTPLLNQSKEVPLIDFSWIVQSIVQRQRLSFTSDPRYIVDISNKMERTLYSIKTKSSNLRYDVDDVVQIQTSGKSSYARIVSIENGAAERPGYSFTVRPLVEQGKWCLVDPGICGYTITCHESDLRSHIVLLSSSDYDLIKNGYGEDAQVFTLKTKSGLVP